MKYTNEQYLFSSSDLVNFLACKRTSFLDNEVLNNRLPAPKWTDPNHELIKKLGLEHEEKYVAYLRTQKLFVDDLTSEEKENRFVRTKEAMRKGVDIIVQAHLKHEEWHGFADILRKVDRKSDLGDWSYEVWDTKLSQMTKGNTIIQLCLYSKLLQKMQGGDLPEKMYVVKPGDPFEEESFEVRSYIYYFENVRNKFLENMNSGASETYPDKVGHCDMCRWWLECNKVRRKDDNLCFVAGLSKGHEESFKNQKINTLSLLAKIEKEQLSRPASGNIETLQKLQQQAFIQKRSSIDNIVTEYLDYENEGLYVLPEPNEGDVHFDIESDRFYQNEGIEYMLGIYFRENGKWIYKNYLGFTRKDEKKAFDSLMIFFDQRSKTHPGFRVYHYGHKEPTALKQLAMKHMLHENLLDKFLRSSLFVDLYAIFKKSFRAGIESYGLKDVEKILDFEREQDLKVLSSTIRRVQRALELEMYDKLVDKDVEVVALYNKDDCRATKELQEWLEIKRNELIREGFEIDRPVFSNGEARENIGEWELRIQKTFQALTSDLPEDPIDWNDQERAKFLLANLVGYYRREFKVKAWENFRLMDLEPEEYLYERKVMGFAKFIEKVEPQGRQTKPGFKFEYEEQELSIKTGEDFNSLNSDETLKLKGGIRHWDEFEKSIVLTMGSKTENLPIKNQAYHISFSSNIPTGKLDKSLGAYGDTVATNNIDDCGWQLLTQAKPRFLNSFKIQNASYHSGFDKAFHIVDKLDRSVLAIQGPPGTGKTHSAAELILKLKKDGKKVGVTALSHKVIQNLLEKVLELSEEKGMNTLVGKPKAEKEGIQKIQAKDFVDHIATGMVVGGTIFSWVSQDNEVLDYLFIDEAGQLALANVMSICRCTTNIVLMGDPQQLQQPSQAAHPNGSHVSALKHYIGEKETIGYDQGVFLESTWRMHPSITQFTSEMYYESRLRIKNNVGVESQKIGGLKDFLDPGLFLLSVEHNNCKNKSLQEINRIKELYNSILKQKAYWINVKGEKEEIGEGQIMVIAPYNAQVNALKLVLGENAKVGTVDKFQGQEAPIVIYSATSSSAEDAPRGISFLYEPNRLNVASSRARCCFIMVANPKLFEAECNSPKQIKMVNGMCRYKELANQV